MIKVNNTFKNLIPPLSIDEYTALEQSIIAEGVRDAIVTWNGYIVDGHNRHEIATRHGLTYRTIEREFADEDAVIVWMIDNQLARRNINDGIKYKLAVQKRDVLERIGLKKMQEMGAVGRKIQSNGGLSVTDNPPFPEAESITHPEQPKKASVPHNTREQIAATLGWSAGKVAQADVVFRAEVPIAKELQQKVISGDLTINAAYLEVKAAEKKAERVDAIQKQMVAIESGELPELKGLYDVVSIDPPWPYEGENRSVTSYDSNGRRVANPYPEMSIDQIKSIDLPLTDNAVVFLWTTHKFLPDAFNILAEWGLEYKATLVWDKQKIGMGAWFRMQCEFCIVGVKGKPYWDNTTYRDILSEARREHSRKPDCFFDMVNAITMGRKLEYFSREKRSGWEVFGNDTDKF